MQTTAIFPSKTDSTVADVISKKTEILAMIEQVYNNSGNQVLVVCQCTEKEAIRLLNLLPKVGE
jgi:hypothetical protein